MNELQEFEDTKKLVTKLLETKHYQAIGPQGIFAIVTKARAMGISPFDALNGQMYYVQGHVELRSTTMNQLIRQAKHSITKDKKSDETICILHGRRSDTGDTWSESFSMEEAIRAGIANGPSWKKYPKDMLFARALSRLARQLFPDVIQGCYVEGELPRKNEAEMAIQEPEVCLIAEKPVNELQEALDKVPVYKENILSIAEQFFGSRNIEDFSEDFYNKALNGARQALVEAQTQGEF